LVRRDDEHTDLVHVECKAGTEDDLGAGGS
jgi:hypothetical protein